MTERQIADIARAASVSFEEADYWFHRRWFENSWNAAGASVRPSHRPDPTDPSEPFSVGGLTHD